MNDFITFSYPSCGAPLKIEYNSTTYTCIFCGQNHRVRVEDIEEFGRCPVCHRNDKVEKVWAIRHKKDNLSARLAPPKDPEKNFVYQPKPEPKPLQKPTLVNGIVKSKYSKLSKILLFSAIGLFTLFVVLVLKDPTRYYQFWFLLFSFFGFVLSIVFFIKGKVDGKILNKTYQEELIRNWQLKNERIQKDYSEYIQKYDHDFQTETSTMKEKYSTAMERYDQLYYCHRDDCVFIPGKSGYAPSAKIEDFLYKQTSGVQASEGVPND